MTGCEKLNAWLNERGSKQKWLSEKIGVPGPTISAWVTGRHVPIKAHREKLEEATGGAVMATDWDNKE